MHCQTRANLCRNVTCENNGVCRAVLRNYTCDCLGDIFSGRHCEIASTAATVLKIVAKTLGFVAIISLVTVVVFVNVMDMMKYWLGIDATAAEIQEIRKEKAKKKAKPDSGVRFTYINHPAPTIKVTTV